MPDQAQPKTTRHHVVFGQELAPKDIGQFVVDLINKDRAQQGLDPLPETDEEADALNKNAK